MGKYEDTLGRIDTATNAVSDKVMALKETIKTNLANAGVSLAEEDAFLLQFDAIADRLNSIAADPTDPVPTDPAPAEPTEPTPTEPTTPVEPA